MAFSDFQLLYITLAVNKMDGYGLSNTAHHDGCGLSNTAYHNGCGLSNAAHYERRLKIRRY